MKYEFEINDDDELSKAMIRYGLDPNSRVDAEQYINAYIDFLNTTDDPAEAAARDVWQSRQRNQSGLQTIADYFKSDPNREVQRVPDQSTGTEYEPGKGFDDLRRWSADPETKAKRDQAPQPTMKYTGPAEEQ